MSLEIYMRGQNDGFEVTNAESDALLESIIFEVLDEVTQDIITNFVRGIATRHNDEHPHRPVSAVNLYFDGGEDPSLKWYSNVRIFTPMVGTVSRVLHLDIYIGDLK